MTCKRAARRQCSVNKLATYVNGLLGFLKYQFKILTWKKRKTFYAEDLETILIVCFSFLPFPTETSTGNMGNTVARRRSYDKELKKSQ